MKAVRYARYGGPETLEYGDAPDPAPGPGEALVALRAASVVPADWKVRSGLLREVFPVSFPKIPGRDGAGVVTALGPGADWTRIGARLCVVAQHDEDGTYAGAIARGQDQCVAMPENLSFAEGAALMHAGICAWIMLVETARVARGDRVLILGGAGAVGGAAVQIARHLGCVVTATCRDANRGYVRGLGAERALAYDRGDFVREAGEQDVVLDLVGGETHERACAALRRDGAMVWLAAAPFRDRGADHGVSVRRAQVHDRPHALKAVADLAALGALRPQIAGRAPLSQAAEAHRRLERGEITRGRLVLEIPAEAG